eukprot:197022_1
MSALSTRLVGWIGAIICICLWFVIINLVVCYHRLLPHEEALQHRRPKIVLIMGYLAVTYMALQPIVILSIFGVINDPSGILSGHGSTFVYSFVIILSVPIFYLSIWRGYKIYFDIKFNQALQDEQWRMSINPLETNWFLKHKPTWGDGQRVAVILSVIYCIFASMSITRTWFIVGAVDAISRYILGVHVLILTSFLLILYFKFPAFDDIWGVRKEIQLSSLSTSVVVLIYIGSAGILKIESDSPYYMFVLYMAIAGTMFPILSSMLWVFRQFGLPWNIFGLSKHLRHQNRVKVELPVLNTFDLSNHLNSSFEGGDDDRVRMRHMLQHENGFNLFARHLTKEFSMENMLFFLETQQWIKFILRLHQQNPYLVVIKDRSKFHDLCSIKFPDNVPKSSIVQSPERIEETEKKKEVAIQVELSDDDKVYLCAVEIFKKYIINQAYFCINISFQQRAKLYVLFGWEDSKPLMDGVMVKHLKEQDLHLLKLMHVFDHARAEVYNLMSDGFKRFKASGEFLQHREELPALSPEIK